MEKEVLLRLKGLQFAVNAEGAEAIETITPAEYYQKNGSHYIIYEEVTEGFSDPTRNMIKFKTNQVEVTKKGLMNVHMVFEEKKKNMTSYVTPYGNILIGIDTADVAVQEEESHIKVDVQYTLEANYEHLADCRIEIDIHPRDERISLQ